MSSLARLVVVIVVIAGCSQTSPEQPAGPAPVLRVANAPAGARVSEIDGLELLELVTGGADEREPLPLILAIHGLGDNPAHFAGLFKGFGGKARIVVPRGLRSHGQPRPFGQGYAWMVPRGGDAVFVPAAGAPADRLAIVVPMMGEATDRLAGLIQAVSELRPTRGRAVVTGFSQGGILSFTLATIYPDLVEAAVPVGGWLPRFAWPEEPREAGGARRPFVSALNGERDRLSPAADVRQSIARLGQSGFQAEVRIYRGVAHAISPRMRDDLFVTLAAAIGGAGGPAPCEPCPGESTGPGRCSICPAGS
jgi:phospholipase/carboxylesterase